MKLVMAFGMSLLFPLAASAAEGGELGNAFMSFSSYYGRFEVEYQKSWQLNDLKLAASFEESSSYFSVVVMPGAPSSSAGLLARLRVEYPGVDWAYTTVSGKPAYGGAFNGERLLFVLRAPGDALSLRLKSGNGERSDAVLAHMLASFRVN